MLVSLIMLSMLTLQCGRFAHSFRPNWKRSLASRLRAVDYIFTSEQQVGGAVLTLKKLRPRLQVLTGVGVGNVESGGAIWASYSGGMQLDACSLEPQYIGSRGLDAEDTAQVWKQQIEDREQKVANKRPQCSYIQGISVYQQELDLAIIIVQTATNLVRSLQAQLVSSAVSKPDNTPVAVADLAVQALVLDTLQVSFPNDRFIAEEDSSLVRSDSGIGIKDHVLQILNTVAGGGWSDERLYAALDLTPANDADNDDRSGHRVWVLDPIDGTKGFLRGEHCCIALGLLVDGKTQLSVLGCPNLNLKRVLQNEADMCAIDKPFRISSDITLFPPDIGAIFFAVSGHGAYARSLGMVPGAACEVSVSTVAEAGTAVLCESAEGGFGDRAVTAKVAADLELQRDFTRIDGMCKHCLVGSGAAEATLRLPPAGYIEKVWDHVAGDHFVREAGGKVTDLQGRELDFSAKRSDSAGHRAAKGGGRELSADVTGVIISNGLLHQRLLDAVLRARLPRG